MSNNHIKDNYIHYPKKSHLYTIIYLHGFMGIGHDYNRKFISSKFIQDNCKVIFPTAPILNITIYNKKYHSWYDYLTDSKSEEENKINLLDLEKANNKIKKIIDSEYKILKDYKKIYIGGVSQGVSTSFHIFMSYRYNLGGYFGVMGNILKDSFNKIKKNVPMVFFSSLSDKIIKWKWTKKNILLLQKDYTNVKVFTENNVSHESYKKEKEWFNKLVLYLLQQ